MSEHQKKPTYAECQQLAPSEKKGVAIIVALFLATYVFVILVLGGQVPGEPFLMLDPTGHLRQAGQRWANASILYRERMVPVFIIAFYYYLMVMVVTFMATDWKKVTTCMAIHESKYWRICVAVILVLVGSIGYFSMGRAWPIESPRELSRFFVRPVFANKYSFAMMFAVLTLFSYSITQLTLALGVKIKLALTKEKRHGE